MAKIIEAYHHNSVNMKTRESKTNIKVAREKDYDPVLYIQYAHVVTIRLRRDECIIETRERPFSLIIHCS